VDILGEKPDIYVKEGSTLNLTCAIVSGGVNEPAAAAQIHWLKDGLEVDVMRHSRSNYNDYNDDKWSRSSPFGDSNNNMHTHSSRHKAAKLAALRRFRRLKDADSSSGDGRSNPRRTRALSTSPPSPAPGSSTPTPSTPIIVTKPKLSRLIVLRATKQDSGVYKCVPPHGNASRVFVHVIQGEFENRFRVLELWI
jgi:hypothetical protein